MRTYWKRNVAENMQVEYTAERKAMFPLKLFVFSSSSLRRMFDHFHLHLQARDSFFACGLFPSRASISVMVWGVIWDKIWNKWRQKYNVSLIFGAHAICFFVYSLLHMFLFLPHHFGVKEILMDAERTKFFTWRAPRFSISCSAFETPRSTELTPSLRRHQAEKENKEFRRSEQQFNYL